MKQWLSDMISAEIKTALPILSFPSVSLMGITVRELISDSDRQAQGMKLVADRVRSAAAVSLMDLSVEAECFGATIRVSDEEVPTVVGRLIHDEEEAVRRVVRMIKEGKVTAITGKDIAITADSVCVHGDSEKARAFVQKLRDAFAAEGIQIVPLTEIVK